MSRSVPKRVMEDIRARNDIADVIGSYFALKRMGTSLKALCPFHKEKSPSFVVNITRQSFHCFGCGVGGDVFSFIQQKEGVDFPTALKMLAERAGIPLEMEEGDRAPGGVDKKAVYTLLHELSLFYQRCLATMDSAAAARAYLKQRALKPETQELFRIGYAPNRWDAMGQWAQKHNVTPELLEAAGMVIRNENAEPGREFYDRFRDRVMFPISDELGRIVGFSGRILSSDKQAAKYVNSPETLVFRKSRILYALDKARKDMVETRRAVLCEGQIDVIRCHEAGFTTAVASQGTAFTEEHANILKRYADEVVVVFDSDGAGQTAAVKAASVFMQAGMSVQVARLPPGEDPDSLILKQGPSAFQAVINNPQSVVAFQIAVLSEKENMKSEVGLMRISKAVLETVGQSANAVQRAAMIQEASERLSLPPSALQDELKRSLRRRRPDDETTSPAPAPPSVIPTDELAVCELLFHVDGARDVVDLIRHFIPLDMISHPLCRTLIAAALESARTGEDILAVLRNEGQDNPEAIQLASRLIEAPSKLRSKDLTPGEAVKDMILRLWRRRITNARKLLDARTDMPDEDKTRERAQLTLDINSLDQWDNGRMVIELALGV